MCACVTAMAAATKHVWFSFFFSLSIVFVVYLLVYISLPPFGFDLATLEGKERESEYVCECVCVRVYVCVCVCRCVCA